MVDKELTIRKKAFVFFSALSSIFLFYFGYFNYSYGLEKLGLFEMASAVLIFINLLAFLYFKNYRVASSIYLLILSVVFTVLFVTGGIDGTGIFWIYLYPILISFLKEPKEALAWNLAFTLVIIGVLIASNFGLFSPPYRERVVEQAMVVYFSILILSHFYSKLSAELVESMRILAVKDTLTGLYNRAFALSYLAQEIEKVKRGELGSLCIAYIDLDNFKGVNDALGHAAGDKVLAGVADILKQYFRKGDVVARIGGDEFLVVFTNCNPQKIEKRLESLRSKIESRFRNLGISFSYGLASAPEDGLVPNALIKVADERMYEYKKKNKEESPELPSTT